MAPFPKLNGKLVVTCCVALFICGPFVIGIQSYVLVNYTQMYGDNLSSEDGDKAWGDAYNGLAIANAAACFLIGLFCLTTVSERKASLLIVAMVLDVVGVLSSLAATVLSALETDKLNLTFLNGDTSSHPCNKQGLPDSPSNLECTNWVYLEVTVAVLSAAACCFLILMAVTIAIGLAGGSDLNVTHSVAPSTTVSMAPTNFNDKPYNPYMAYNQGPGSTIGGPQPKSGESDLYQDLNPAYIRHLQQLSVQQFANEQLAQQPQTSLENPPRGRLQVMSNQRNTRPPVAPKPGGYYNTGGY